jgi:hypothetical protein
MTLSDKERVAAKVEELDKLIGELQRRRRELLEAGAAPVASDTAPTTTRKEPPEVKVPVKVETPAQPVARTTVVRKVKDPLEGVLDTLPWKSFKKKEGEWAFLRDREGGLVEELRSEKEFVDRLRKEGQVVVGKYRYQISDDKFLNKYYAGT